MIAAGVVLAATFVIAVVDKPVSEAPAPIACEPTTPVCPEPVVVKAPPAKPVIYVNKESFSFGWNQEALKLLQTTHVLHIQYANGYDVVDMRGNRVKINMVAWPDSWYDGVMTIGIYNPSTGKYAVSVRVQ